MGDMRAHHAKREASSICVEFLGKTHRASFHPGV